MIIPSDILAVAAAVDHGKRVVRERRERQHAEWVAARNRARTFVDAGEPSVPKYQTVRGPRTADEKRAKS